MEKKELTTLVAPCGIDCGICECHLAKDNPALLEYLVSKGIRREVLPCPGCRAIKGDCPTINHICPTYLCAKEKEADFCYQCGEFPCSKLIPAADRAEILPHNLKVFNLCCIQQQGLEVFESRSREIKQKYYKGKMVVGEGPKLDQA